MYTAKFTGNTKTRDYTKFSKCHAGQRSGIQKYLGEPES